MSYRGGGGGYGGGGGGYGGGGGGYGGGGGDRGGGGYRGGPPGKYLPHFPVLRIRIRISLDPLNRQDCCCGLPCIRCSNWTLDVEDIFAYDNRMRYTHYRELQLCCLHR